MYHGGCLVGVFACILCICSFGCCVLCCGWGVICAVFVVLIYRVFCACPLPLYSVCIFGRYCIYLLDKRIVSSPNQLSRMNTQIKQTPEQTSKQRQRQRVSEVINTVKDFAGFVAVMLLFLTNPYGSTLFWVAFALMWVLLLEPIAALMGWIENPFRRIWEEAKRQHPEP